MKLSTSKETVTLARRRHKILIVGDSHFRDLPKKISNCLDNSFSVVGITKPNADIEAITSPLHFITDNVTKKDLIIFYGGTKFISRNETKKGLRSLKGFAQRTINTNVI
jgi:PleD family two-component response regulator